MNDRIVFMGTPEFAKIQLESLVRAGYNVVAAITQPDKPTGRKQILTPPPVKVFAESLGIPVYQPETLRGEEFMQLLRQLDPALVAVAAYGKILPSDVLYYPKHGCINVHASLLPRWRGAAPINRAIMAGDTVTGVTIMRMDEGLDTGDMIVWEEVPILPDDTYGTLHDKLAGLGAKLLCKAIELIFAGRAEYTPQTGEPTYAAKITTEDGQLDFSRPALELHNIIRGLSPEPLAYCNLRGNKIKIATSSYLPADSPEAPHVPPGTPPGTVVAVNDSVLEGCRILRCDDTITVACGRDFLKISHILPAGKRLMCASDFYRGRNICAGDRLC